MKSLASKPFAPKDLLIVLIALVIYYSNVLYAQNALGLTTASLSDSVFLTKEVICSRLIFLGYLICSKKNTFKLSFCSVFYIFKCITPSFKTCRMKNLLYTFLILMSCSCASSKKITTLTLDKSPCLGDCVSYSLSFVKKGGATFFVYTSQGKTSSIKLPAAIEKEICSQIDAVSTEELNPFYGRKGELDLQKIKLQLKGTTIEINGPQHIPKELQSLMNTLDQLIQN